MEYDDNISNDTLPMFEPHPDIYIHLKLEEIINSHLAYPIDQIDCPWIGWCVHNA